MSKPRLVAFYLPQFHPIPENSQWWGTGFTEWTNVTKAKPLFPNHYQPRLPADLGFYDLRVPESRAAQADLARTAGVEAFCYWHYWFAGRRVLERPFNEVLASKEPDFPFCLAWANDTWSGHWYGAPKRTLIEQTYPGPDDHERHFYSLLPAFLDPRYLRVHDRPIFTLFRPKSLPNPQAFIDLWQKLAAQNGLPGIHFIAHLFDHELDFPWKSLGFHAAVVTNELKLLHKRFLHIAKKRLALAQVPHPHSSTLAQTLSALTEISRLASHRLRQRLFNYPGGIHFYRDAILFFSSPLALSQGCYPSIVPGWDNTARAGRSGTVLHGSTPELFTSHLQETFHSVAHRPAEENLVFIKSWNEWAEGNYLEPDQKFGHAYLHALRATLDSLP